jgi:hypothetical protein
MVLFGRKHLHIAESDQIADAIVKLLGSITSGSLKLEIANRPTMEVEINKNVDKKLIKLNLLEPTFFRIPEDETSLFDKLRTATEFAQKLADSGITLSLLRMGKESITLGEEAKPSFSRLVTKSDDIQIKSMKESMKLKGDFKDEDQ